MKALFAKGDGKGLIRRISGKVDRPTAKYVEQGGPQFTDAELAASKQMLSAQDVRGAGASTRLPDGSRLSGALFAGPALVMCGATGAARARS
jgi:hypothetical protein